jgi:hypothetical protein
MKLKPHPLYDRIVALLRTKPLRYRKWSGLGFRSVTLEYAGGWGAVKSMALHIAPDEGDTININGTDYERRGQELVELKG